MSYSQRLQQHISRQCRRCKSLITFRYQTSHSTPPFPGSTEPSEEPFRASIYDRIFQNSEFQSLTLSKHGSLIQDRDEENEEINKYRTNDLEYHDEEEELNISFGSLLKRQHSDQREIRSLKQKFVKRALSNNPYEMAIFTKIREHHDKKIPPSSFTDFMANVIGSENSIKDYSFKIPEFPTELTTASFKKYLRDVNAIDFNYDLNNYEKIIFFQVFNLSKRLVKFDGIVDIEIMHEFIKFFGKYLMFRNVFKIIEKFEKMGIVPTRDTLHLLIYQLKGLDSWKVKSGILKTFMLLGLNIWKISPDITTSSIVYQINNPSKKRMGIGKALINEGGDKNGLELSLWEDFFTESIHTGHMGSFDLVKLYGIKTLQKLININDNNTDIFALYIKVLVRNNHESFAIGEIINYPQYEQPENWRIVITNLIEQNEIWNCFAIVNLVYTKHKNIDIKMVILPLLNMYYKIYNFFKRQDFENHDTMVLYCCIMKILQELSGVEVENVKKFIDGILIREDAVVDKTVEDNIRRQFSEITVTAEQSIVDAYSAMDSNTKLKDTEKSRDIFRVDYKKKLCFDPSTFPWR